ncbi:MAG TPA: phage/plasmid primase, P4 family, partial [Candidatus Methanoperedens sp.]|nr:phage/plasmid primase, P4 family [Candidatus Methanoperedens sp.]
MFSSGVATRLGEINFKGVLKEIRIVGVKDPCELHRRNPENFKTAFQAAMDTARDIPVSAPPMPSAIPVSDGETPDFHTTDLGNAKRLVTSFGSKLRYCHLSGKWHIYDGTRWAQDDTGAIYRLARKTVASIYREAAAATDSATRRALAAHASRSESESRIRAMVTLATSEEGIPVTPRELDADPYKLNVKNGTIDLRTGMLHPHNPSDLITKVAAVSYDPGAQAPLFDRFMTRIMDGNANQIRFLQVFLGYCLTGDTREEVFLIGFGEGANGKTTLIETIAAIIKDYVVTADFRSLAVRRSDGPRNDIARLRGARFVPAVEAGEGLRLDEELIKRLTGRDTISARFLYGEYFDFKPQFKLILATNHKPRIAGTDRAIWRRIRLVPFLVTIPEREQDKSLPEKLLAEAPGILNWLLEGCRDWQKNGLGYPDEVRLATDAYRSEEDPLADFLSLDVLTGQGQKATAGDLYQAYRRRCERNGEDPIPQRTFG